MPDFLRWIIAGVTSVVVAGLVFLLATVGIVVAFFVFLVLFVVFGLAMRRARKNVQYGEDGSRFIIYTNIYNYCTFFNIVSFNHSSSTNTCN